MLTFSIQRKELGCFGICIICVNLLVADARPSVSEDEREKVVVWERVRGKESLYLDFPLQTPDVFGSPAFLLVSTNREPGTG